MDGINSQGSDITPDPNLSSDNELQYHTLIPFKNHVNGLAKFNRDVVIYKHKPTINFFVNCLKMVMKDQTCSSPQQHLLQIISVWAAWNEVRPLTLLTEKANLPKKLNSKMQ